MGKGVGFGVNVSGGGSTGGTPPSPGNVQSVSATGYIDETTGYATITVTITPPATLGTFVGCHLFAEIPDQSYGSNTFVIGVSAIGTGTLDGPWKPIDLGRQVYNAGLPFWTIQIPLAGLGLATNVTIPARIYAVSYSNAVENTLVQANLSGASPNCTVNLVPLSNNRQATSNAALTTVAASGIQVSAVVDDALFVGGVSQTPVAVSVSNTPVTPLAGWCYQLVLTFAGQDPTQQANQYVLTGLFTNSGLVPAGADGVSVPHTCLLPTPANPTTAYIWLEAGFQKTASGRLGSGGVNPTFNAQAIVPGITPCCSITYGDGSGTLDGGAFVASTLAASLAVTGAKLGVPNSGITLGLIASLAIAGPELAANSVNLTNAALAALTVLGTNIGNAQVGPNNMGTNSVTALNGALAALAVVAGNMAAGSITAVNGALSNLVVGNAQLANLAVTDAKVNDLSVSKLTAGTITATISINAPTIQATGGFQVGALSGSGFQTTISNSSFFGVAAGLGVYDGSTFLAAIAPAQIAVGLNTGPVEPAVMSLAAKGGGAYTGELELSYYNGSSSLQMTLQCPSALATSASAGSYSIPNAAGFLPITYGGVTYKIPLCAN